MLCHQIFLASVNSTYTDIVTSVFSSAIFGKIKWALPGKIFGASIGTVHRWSGRLAFLFTLPVAFHCIFILGFQTYSTRVLIHSILGSFFYGFFAVKVLVVRDHSLPGWALPVAGGTLFAVLASLWFTSAYWYFTTVRFGF
jgi:hypothetical protein